VVVVVVDGVGEVEVKVVEALLALAGMEQQLFFARKVLFAQLFGQGEEEVDVGGRGGVF